MTRAFVRHAAIVACQASYEQAKVDCDGTLQLDRAVCAVCPSNLIDCAVLERVGDDPTLTGVIVPLTAGWSDVAA